MHSPNLVIAQTDSAIANSLRDSLHEHFNFIYVVRDFDQVRTAMIKYRPQVVILDMEMAPLSQLEQLRRDFAAVNVVCTHRLADEDMWVEALSAGASDICRSSDVRGIVHAALQPATRAMAA